MSSLAAEYCDQIKKHFKKFHATFPPNETVRLGDYGVLYDDVFVRLGNVERLGMQFGVREGVSQASLVDFTSKGSVEVEFGAAADAGVGTAAVKASVEIKFSRENAVFFNAADCTIDAVEDQVAFGAEILKLKKADRWEKKYAVVTSLLRAKSTTIAVSSSSNASIKFEASTPSVKEIDLADASLKLNVKRVKDVSLKIVTGGDLVPLIGLSKIQGGILETDDFGPLRMLIPGQKNPAPADAPTAFVAID